MAQKLIVVHGYSDGYMKDDNAFQKLRTFLAEKGAYRAENIHFVEYSSMDSQATFEDFADKLDSDYRKYIASGRWNGTGGGRVDILCHSTGSLVTRAWLAKRRQRQREQGQEPDLPVERLFMMAPANFGSDLARMGQSFLGKLRCTFFNKNARKGNAWETGKIILQGLEPASPYQWNLSHGDLLRETYFGPNDDSGLSCYPFVFAAGEGYGGLQAKVIRARNKPGTDGTVRICGTSMDVRKCWLRFTEDGAKLQWLENDPKHPEIPFAVFQGFNHGSLINPDENGFEAPNGPGTLLVKAARMRLPSRYPDAVEMFREASEANYASLADDDENGDRYQQFFFKVHDDAGFAIEDFFIDFNVETPYTRRGAVSYRKNTTLSDEFDRVFETRVTAHSQDRSCRAFLVNLRELGAFLAGARERSARIVVDVTARRPYDEVSYDPGSFLVHDTAAPDANHPFIRPNTTTLVEIVMNRRQSDEVLKLRRTLPS